MPAYDVALTFAGEDRAFVEPIAVALRDAGYSVFYDKFETAELWGRNLYDHLHELYSERARFCVIFVSKAYAAKPWTRLERRAAQARSFRDATDAYLLPIRVDDTPLPGLPETTGYVDVKVGSEAIVALLRTRLGSPRT